MDPFTTLLRPSSSPPPMAWLFDDPAGWEPTAGKGITIVTDPDDTEAGRAIGFVSPPSGGRCYLKGPDDTTCIPTPPESPDGYRIFHADTIEIDGEQVAIGSIALGGGHSNKVDARTPVEAREFLQRKARWASMADDIALYGRVEHTDEGHLFRGWVAEPVTVAEAEMINRTIMSGEWIPDPELNGRLVFAGVARVQRTALPMRALPMAADLASCDCADEGSTVFTFAPADLEEPMSGKMIPPQPPVTIEPAPIQAEMEDEVAELRGLVNDLTVQVEALTEEVQVLSAMAVEDEAADAGGPTITLEEVMQKLIENEEKLAQIQGVADRARADEAEAMRQRERQEATNANRPAAVGALPS